jgi:hypothetical protein
MRQQVNDFIDPLVLAAQDDRWATRIVSVVWVFGRESSEQKQWV